MAKRSASLAVRSDQPLIGVILREGGEDVTCYFADEKDADAAVADSALKKALSAIGAWSDLDWDDMERELHRIRHESKPTLPITDL